MSPGLSRLLFAASSEVPHSGSAAFLLRSGLSSRARDIIGLKGPMVGDFVKHQLAMIYSVDQVPSDWLVEDQRL